MYTGTFAPWENAPKMLRHDEMIHPLRVVIDFFEIDHLNGHSQRLKEWRDYAVKVECYENEKHGPGVLLYTWEEHVKLIEAMYLLYHEYRNGSWQFKKASEEQLSREKEAWDYFPTKLSTDWIANPYLAIEKLFEKMSLAVYRNHLYEWLIMAMSKTAFRDPDLDAEDVITVYENILQLQEAAWIICQRNSDRPHLISQDNNVPKESQVLSTELLDDGSSKHLNVAHQVGDHAEDPKKLLKPFYPKPSPACTHGLQKVKEDILARYPTVQMIVYLGSHADPFTCYLLILVSNDEKTEEGHLATNIENHLKTLVSTHIILHKASSALAALSKSNRFWTDALSQGQVIYWADDLPAFDAKPMLVTSRIEKAQFHWNLWGKQGEELLKGAEFFHQGGNHRQAAFLLHRATETTLKGIIQAILGYRIQMHNLARLLRLTLLFTNNLQLVFKLDTEVGANEFEFLKSGYVQAYYNENFATDSAVIAALLTKVSELNNMAEVVYKFYIKQLVFEDFD